MTDNYITTIDNSFGTLEPGPELNPKCFDLEHEKMQDQMNKYMIETHAKYNKSQCKVLEQVIEMPQDDVLLIQGPVSILLPFHSLFFYNSPAQVRPTPSLA